MTRTSQERVLNGPNGEPWYISWNVTRTRVTLLGFNLPVVAFLSGTMLTVYQQQAFTHYFPVMSSLFLAFTFSFLSASCLMASQELDREGLSRPWLFFLGDVLMYLALSQSLAAMVRRYLSALDQAVVFVQDPADASGAGAFVLEVLSGVGVIAWCLTIYAGPIVSILRSPLRPRSRGLLFGIYVGFLLVIFSVATDAHRVQDIVLDEPEPTWRIFLWQFLQPLTW